MEYKMVPQKNDKGNVFILLTWTWLPPKHDEACPNDQSGLITAETATGRAVHIFVFFLTGVICVYG